MPEYSTRKFATLISLSIIVGLLVVSLAPLALNYLLPGKRVYYQLLGYDHPNSKPSPTPWVKLNHTLVVLGNRVESLVSATAVLEPAPSSSNVSVGVTFNTVDNLVPTLIEGDLTWTGEFHQGQVAAVRSLFVLEQDGRYFIGGFAASFAPYGMMGDTTTYYVYIQGGTVTKVTNELDLPLLPEVREFSRTNREDATWPRQTLNLLVRNAHV